MTFKIKLIALLLLTISFVSCNSSSDTTKESQEKTHEQIIEDDIVVFMEDYMSEGNWEGVIDMMYPKLFTISPKEQIVAQMKQMEEMGIKITGENTEVVDISEVMNYQGEQFCEVGYVSDLTIKISGEALQMISLLEPQFKEVYGANNVTFDKENNQFLVEAHKSMIAVAPENTNDWSYFEFNTNEPKILELLLPEEVRKNFL